MSEFPNVLMSEICVSCIDAHNIHDKLYFIDLSEFPLGELIPNTPTTPHPPPAVFLYHLKAQL